MKYKLERIIYNIKKYGLIVTFKKIFARIFKNNKVQNKSYDEWILEHEPNSQELEAQRGHKFDYNPKISIVVPMYNTDERLFMELLNSLLSQTYINWELCLADGSEKQNDTIMRLCCANKDRVKYIFLEKNNGIAENTNQAIAMCSGDFIAFLDHDDCLVPFALYEVVKQINMNENAEFIYSDEDKIDEKGNRFDPYFKPDFSPETLECNNYITHFVVLKRSLVEKIGKLDGRFDGAQDFDYVLRAMENVGNFKNIIHISCILYHWRATRNSTANMAESKLYAYNAGKKVVEEHLKRIGKKGIVEDPGEVPGIYKIKYEIQGNPKVSIIIPNKDNYKILKNCINSILEKTIYENYEIIVVENNSEDKKIFEFYNKIQENPKVKVVKYEEKEFNYSKIINFGVKNSTGDYILQLNNDTKLLTGDWLELFIGYAQNKEIGAIGGKLYYPDKTIQHAGIAYGIGGTAANLLVNLPQGTHGYFRKSISH